VVKTAWRGLALQEKGDDANVRDCKLIVVRLQGEIQMQAFTDFGHPNRIGAAPCFSLR